MSKKKKSGKKDEVPMSNCGTSKEENVKMENQISKNDLDKVENLKKSIGKNVFPTLQDEGIVLTIDTTGNSDSEVATFVGLVFKEFGTRVEDYKELERNRKHTLKVLIKNKPPRFERVDGKIIERVRGLQVRENNEKEVIAFVGGGKYRKMGTEIVFVFNRRDTILIVQMRNYLLKSADGEISVLPQEDVEGWSEPHDYLTKKFGDKLSKRFDKLNEEYLELKEAAKGFLLYGNDRREELIDELADVNVIIYHIAAIMGVSQKELLHRAMTKILRREYDPGYKRKF